jgi:predicted dehydrogenase
MTQRLRIGAIGAGNNMFHHLKGLLGGDDLELVALADPSTESLARMREKLPATASAKTYADHRAMLDAERLDGVLIGSPHTLHYRQVMDALERGVHVMCEKPLVCSVKDTREIIALANARKLAVVVGYQRRFLGNYRTVRDFVRDPGFGTPLFLQAYQSQYWYKLFPNAWRTDPALSGGGQINDSGSHLIDMLFWILPGRPVEVTAIMSNRGTRVDVDSAISFRCADGCLGNISIHGSGPKAPGMVEDITITGESGRGIYLRRGQVSVVKEEGLAQVTQFPPDRNKDRHWIEVIRGAARNESPPEEFLPTIAFTEACWASAAKGGAPVKVDYGEAAAAAAR